MNKPEHLEMVEDRAEFRPTGQVSLQQMIQMVTSAIAFARERRVRNLLVVAIGLTGFEPPQIIDRFNFIHVWARAADGKVCVALVARPEMIDPQRFGVTVAANAGLTANIFASEAEALRWLESVKRG